MQSWNAIPAIIHHAPVPGRIRRDGRDRHHTFVFVLPIFAEATHMIVSMYQTINGCNDAVMGL